MLEKYHRLVFEVIFVLVGVGIILFNFFVVSGSRFSFISPLLNMLGALIAIVPPFFLLYSRYRVSKEIEEQFILFIMDLTEAIDSGMTLPMALKYTAKRDYGVLRDHIKGMESKVEWGVPFHEALKLFAENIKSVPIQRSVSTIIETYKVGGKVSDTLKAIGQSLIEISKIKAERSASVQSQIITSYLIYFVFIFILIILQTFLIPALGKTQFTEVSEVSQTAEIPTEILSQTFVNFIIIQGFFAGLATGKMSEGSIIAGFKHSLVLMVTGYTIFSLLGQLRIAIF